MKTHRIGVLAGDGIGPEVIAEGLKVLEVLAEQEDFRYELTHFPYNSDLYLETGETMGQDALEEMRKLDAIYFGAVGDPRVPAGILERAIIFTIRFGLDLYVNLRPI